MSKTYTLNKGYSVKKNGRTAPKISKAKFLELVADFNRTYSKKYDCVDFEEKKSWSIYYIMCILQYVLRKEADKQFVSDFKGIKFDWENRDIVGDVHIINGIPCYHLYAGGDWECALHFFFYYDGKRFRVYVPKNGNNWRPDIKCVIGDNDDDDEYCTKVLRKRGELKDDAKIVNATDYITRDDRLMTDEFSEHIKAVSPIKESYIKEDFFDDVEDVNVEDSGADGFSEMNYDFELYVAFKDGMKKINKTYFKKCLDSFIKIETVGELQTFKDSTGLMYPFKQSWPHIQIKFLSNIKTVSDVVRFLMVIWTGTYHNKIMVGVRKREDAASAYICAMPETVLVMSKIRRINSTLYSSMTELNALNQFEDFCRTLFGMLLGNTEKKGILTQNMCRVVLQTNCGAVFRADALKLLTAKYPKYHNITIEKLGIEDFVTTFDRLNAYVNDSLDSGKSVFYYQIVDHDENDMVFRPLKEKEDLNSILEYVPVKTVKKQSQLSVFASCISYMLYFKDNVVTIPLGMYYVKDKDLVMTAAIGISFNEVVAPSTVLVEICEMLKK